MPTQLSNELTTAQVLNEFKAFDLEKSRLYYLETRGVPKASSVSPGGRDSRVYLVDQVERLSVILRCEEAGYSLKHIDSQLTNGGNIARLLPGEKIEQLLLLQQRLMTRALFEGREYFLHAAADEGKNFLGAAWFEWRVPTGGASALTAAASSGTAIDVDRGLHEQLAEHERRCAERTTADVLRIRLPREGTTALAPASLSSSMPVSLMQVPLFGRKGRLAALIRVCSCTHASAGERAFFDPLDEALARTLGRELLGLLTATETLTLSRTLMEQAIGNESLCDYLHTFLSDAAQMCGADRGDVAIEDPATRELVLLAQTETTQESRGMLLPNRSIISRAFEQRKPVVVDDVNKDPEYFSYSAGTRSELAFPLLRILRGRSETLGVLNLESNHKGHFGAEDCSRLHFLAPVAAVAERATASDHLVRQQLRDGQSDHLARILQGIQLGMGFKGALVYLADHVFGELRCVAALPPRPGLDDLTCRFGDASLIYGVFHHKRPSFKDDPWKEAVLPRTLLERLGIRRPVLGVPMMFGTTPIGALIVWGVVDGRTPQPADGAELARHAQLSITTMGRADVEARRLQRIDSLRKVLDRISMMDPAATRDEVLVDILEGIVNGGFDRARVLELKPPPRQGRRTATCVASYGVQEPQDLVGRTIDDTSPHLRDIIAKANEGNFKAGIRHPAEDGNALPFREKMVLPDEHPLAFVPLRVGEELWGHIAADNSETHRAITDDDIEHLTFAGVVAAHAIQEWRLRDSQSTLKLKRPDAHHRRKRRKIPRGA